MTKLAATNEELLAYYGAASWFAIQWHGMAATRCPTTDVHLSHGVDVTPDDKIAVLRDKLLLHHQNPKWRVSLPEPGSCDLNATDNMQGRLLNGVASESAVDLTGRQRCCRRGPTMLPR